MEAKQVEKFVVNILFMILNLIEFVVPSIRVIQLVVKTWRSMPKFCNFQKRKALIKHFNQNINDTINTKTLDFISLSKIQTAEEFHEYFKEINRLFSFYSKKFQISSKYRAEISDCSNREKHKFQYEAIYSILYTNFLAENSTSFVELCAGKGDLSRFVAAQMQIKELQNVSFALIDLKNFKRKQDVYIRNMNFKCERLQLNIQNLDTIKLLQELNAEQCVFYAKHACGKATDISLSAIQKAIEKTTFRGMCIALCCHHQCSWESFFG